MKETIIPAGYRITVTTWENDADNYKTAQLEGLSESETEFVVKLCKLHRSRNATPPGYGNMYDPNEYKRRGYFDAIQELIDTHDGGIPHGCTCSSGVHETLVWGLCLTGEELFTRVCEDFKVEYVPHNIYLQDVTDQFDSL